MNIIWIYCDELRTDSLSCYGAPFPGIQTPNIDSIAESGVLFENCFTNSPVCVSSRTCKLTGLYAEQTGVYHNEAVWNNYVFDRDVVSFTDVFRDSGYQTANFGKTHVPGKINAWDTDNPEGSGMGDINRIAQDAGMDLFTLPDVPTKIGGRFPGDTEYPAQKVTDNALAWLEKAEGPFLCRLSYLQPHTPVYPPPPYDTMYEDIPFGDTAEAVETVSGFQKQFAAAQGTVRMAAEHIRLARQYYYGLVRWIDDQVGRLLTFLKNKGKLENTVIVFDADHGASLGENGCYAKHTFAPEVHRIPRIISCPGMIPRGRRMPDICEGLDLARTLFAFSEIECPEQFRGRDILNSSAPEAVYSTIGYGFTSSRAFPNLRNGDFIEGCGWPRRTCVRTERFRLDMNTKVNGNQAREELKDKFLCDWKRDPAEQTDLAGDPEYSETLFELENMLSEHIADAVEVPEEYTL